MMRRPAFYLSVALGAGVYAAFLCRQEPTFWMGLGLCPVAFLVFTGRRRKVALILLCCFLLGGALYLSADHQAEGKAGAAGKDVLLQGEIRSVSQSADHASLVVRSVEYGDVMVGVYQEKPDYASAVGKTVRVTGLLELPPTAGNPGGFDYRRHLRSVGVFTVMSVRPDRIQVSDRVVNRFSHGISVFRQTFQNKLSRRIGSGHSGLAVAMLFGDKSGLEEETYETFQRNGTAHILSVSGLHVGFLYSLLIFLLGGRRRLFPNLTILSLLMLYCVLSGFCPSVTRALLMIGLHILSKVACRSYDLLSSAGIAGMIILVQNPFSLFHVGFQLSFLAVVLMGWIFPLFGRTLPKGHMLSVLLPIPALQAAMAPYTAFLFNYFSFGAFVANFGVVFFSGLLIPAGLLAMAAAGMKGPLFDLVAVFMDLCIRCVIWCNETAYAGGKTCLDVVSPPVFALVAAYGLFFFGLSETGRIFWLRKKHKPMVCIMVVLICAAGLLDWRTEDGFDKADAVFVDVGQGDCLHIRTPSGKNVLIDGGGKETYDVGKRVLKPYLLKNGVRTIDLAVITHLDTDHYEGIRSLAGEGMVERLGLYEGNRLQEADILKDTGLEKAQLLYLHQGERIQVDPFVWLEVLYPKQKSVQVYRDELQAKEENPRSLVVRVHLGGYRILMTGDIDTATEAEVLAAAPEGMASADILKIGHHGSRYSTSDAFLQAVDPRIAVFLTGKNNYGHPHTSVLEKCREKGIMIYRTDKDGAIGLFGFCQDQNPYLRTFRKEI